MVFEAGCTVTLLTREGTPGRATGFLHNLAREDSWNDVCSGISSEVTLQVEFLSPSLQIDLHKVVHSLGAFFFFAGSQTFFSS